MIDGPVDPKVSEEIDASRVRAWTRKQFRLFVIVLSVTACTASLLQYPVYGGHFAALGDQTAQRAIARGNIFSIVGALFYLLSVLLLYRYMRKLDNRPRVPALIGSASLVFASIILEVLILVVIGYIRQAWNR